MLDYVNRVMNRVAPYVHHVRDEFKTSSGYTREEEDASARIKQFWADDSIPISEKLQGLDFDLSRFDGKNITNRELLEVAKALLNAGLIDMDGLMVFTYPGREFNTQGTQINRDTKIDAFAQIQKQLDSINRMIDGGYVVAKDMIPKQNFALTVLKGLQEHSLMTTKKHWVNVRV
ncbi:hypothetical protein [Pseudomonas gingeri]